MSPPPPPKAVDGLAAKDTAPVVAGAARADDAATRAVITVIRARAADRDV